MAGPRAASFTLWGYGEAARLVEVARFEEATCFDEATCGRDLLSLGVPSKMSDNRPALLTPIGRSTNAAIAAMTVRQRGTTRPEGAIFLPDDGNPYFPQNDFPFVLGGRRLH